MAHQEHDLTRVDGHTVTPQERATASEACVIRTCPHGHIVAACVVDDTTSVAAAVRFVRAGRGGGTVTKTRTPVQMGWCDVCCGPPPQAADAVARSADGSTDRPCAPKSSSEASF
jgi:hypothetical protein